MKPLRRSAPPSVLIRGAGPRSIPAVLCLVLFAMVGATPAPAVGWTERVSVRSDGGQGNSWSSSPSISASGRYVAFHSEATNLVPGDTNGYEDVFVHDRQTGVTQRVSVSSAGEQADGGSRLQTISADGRFVAFVSEATNLVPGDTNISADVFVHDRQTGFTQRVSVSSTGEQADGGSAPDALSADGRFVAFGSNSTNLAPGATRGVWHILVHDRQTGATELISKTSAGEEADRSSGSSAINAEGRFVAFDSYATNLVAEDSNGYWDVFVHDRQTGATDRVSVSSSGGQGERNSLAPDISADGRFVAFESEATDLVPGDTNGYGDIFVHDRQTGATERVNVSSGGEQADGLSGGAAISAEGRFVAFVSYATNLVPGDTNGYADIFVRDRQTGATERVAVSGAGEQADGDSGLPAISADGRCVAFYCNASNLVPGDTNSNTDVFVRVRWRFLDVPPGQWAFAQTEACVEANVVQGYADETYRPSAEVTRDHMAVFISRALVSPSGDAAIPEPEAPSFSDVPADHWAYQWIEYAVSRNVVEGYPGGNYRPDEMVNRGQMAVYIARALVSPSGDAAVPDPPAEPTFPDVTAEGEWSWCYPHVEYLSAEEIVQGYGEGRYRPELAVTRDQMAVFVARAFELPM